MELVEQVEEAIPGFIDCKVSSQTENDGAIEVITVELTDTDGIKMMFDVRENLDDFKQQQLSMLLKDQLEESIYSFEPPTEKDGGDEDE